MKNVEEFSQIISAIEHASREELKELAIIRRALLNNAGKITEKSSKDTGGLTVRRSLSQRTSDSENEKKLPKNDAGNDKK